MSARAVPAHRIIAELELFPSQQGGLKFAVQEGNRSLLFMFPTVENPRPQQGALVEQLFGVLQPGERVAAQVQFFDDSAADVAFVGSEFELWLGRTVGRGVVKEILAD